MLESEKKIPAKVFAEEKLKEKTQDVLKEMKRSTGVDHERQEAEFFCRKYFKTVFILGDTP